MSEISYPVSVAGENVLHDGEVLVGCCAASRTMAIGQARARRIAAALNATRHLTVEQLEACDGRNVALTVFRQLDGLNSGDAAKGE